MRFLIGVSLKKSVGKELHFFDHDFNAINWLITQLLDSYYYKYATFWKSHTCFANAKNKARFETDYAICLVHELQIDGLFPSNLPYSNALKLLQGVSVLK